MYIGSYKRIIYLTIGLILFCIVLLIARSNAELGKLFNFISYEDLSKRYFTLRWTFPAIATIMVGCLTAIIVHKVEIKKLALSSYTFFLGLLIATCFLFLPKSLLGLGYVIQSLGTALIIIYIIQNQNSIIVKLLEFKPLSYIGKISYGLYIYQGIFLGTGPRPNGILIQRYPMNLLLTFAFAIVSYNFVEKRFLKLKRHLH